MSINEHLDNIIKKYGITDTDCIIYGTNIPMPNRIIPTPWKTYIRFDKTEYYFFRFDLRGISVYPINGEPYASILWSDITDFKIKHILILGKMTIKTNAGVFKFQLNRNVIGCPWIKENTRHLESVNYFYDK